METFYIPTENDFKRWIKEAVTECLKTGLPVVKLNEPKESEFLNRKEIAKVLNVSLVTITDWVKRGLPSHKQRGRVYFDKAEVLNYIKDKKQRQIKFGSKLYHLKDELALTIPEAEA